MLCTPSICKKIISHFVNTYIHAYIQLAIASVLTVSMIDEGMHSDVEGNDECAGERGVQGSMFAGSQPSHRIAVQSKLPRGKVPYTYISNSII